MVVDTETDPRLSNGGIFERFVIFTGRKINFLSSPKYYSDFNLIDKLFYAAYKFEGGIDLHPLNQLLSRHITSSIGRTILDLEAFNFEKINKNTSSYQIDAV